MSKLRLFVMLSMTGGVNGLFGAFVSWIASKAMKAAVNHVVENVVDGVSSQVYREIVQQMSSGGSASEAWRAEPLSSYWQGVCNDTNASIGGEYILITGENELKECFKQCRALEACHPLAGSPGCTTYAQVATLRGPEDLLVASTLVDAFGTVIQGGGKSAFVGYRNDIDRCHSDQGPPLDGWHWILNWRRQGNFNAGCTGNLDYGSYMYADRDHPIFDYTPPWNDGQPHSGSWPLYVHYSGVGPYNRSWLSSGGSAAGGMEGVSVFPDTSYWGLSAWNGPNCLCERYSRDACPASPPAVISVQPGVGTLQAALDAARDSDELVLADGIYEGSGDEVIKIEKSITIRAMNARGAILNGQDARRVVSIVTSGSVVLEGLKITGGRGTSSVSASHLRKALHRPNSPLELVLSIARLTAWRV